MHNHLSEVLREKGSTVYSVGPDHSVKQAVDLMNDKGVGSVLVMEGERVRGIFTERDVLRRVVAVGLSPDDTLVREVMTSDCIVVEPKTTVGETMSVITEKRVRHLPVVDGQKLLGLVSIGDLTRWVVRSQRFELKELYGYITGRYPG